MIMLYEVRCLHYIKEYLFKKSWAWDKIKDRKQNNEETIAYG